MHVVVLVKSLKVDSIYIGVEYTVVARSICRESCICDNMDLFFILHT